MMATNTIAPGGDSIVLRGGCRCGNITYTSTTLPTAIGNCHCQACRQISGGPYVTFADFPVSSIKWFSTDASGTRLLGDSAMTEYSSNPFAVRGFCANCGSTVRLWYKCDPKRYHIAAGSIDEESLKGELPKMGYHIFLKEKARWEVIGEDGLHRREGFSEEGFDEKIEEWMREHPEEVEKVRKATFEILQRDNTWPN